MTYDSPQDNTNNLSGEELENLIKEIRDIAGEKLGLTNYVHVEDCLYIADDGTFTVEASRTIEESPIGAPTESEILRKENVEEIGLWEKELFWSWDNRYMKLRASVDVKMKSGDIASHVFIIDDKVKDMSHWRDSYIESASDRGSIIENTSGESEDEVFGSDGYSDRKRSGKLDENLEDSVSESIEGYQNDEASKILAQVHGLWFGEDDIGLCNYFDEPQKESAFDIRQRTERKRVKMNAQKFSEILNEIDRLSASKYPDSAVLRDNKPIVERLYSAYNGLDNEVRANGTDEYFDESWQEMMQNLRVLFSIIREM